MKKIISLCALATFLCACTPQEATPEAQKSSQQITAQGFMLLGGARSGDAITLFDQAIAQDGRNVRAYQGKAIALADQGKFSEAESLYKTALTIDPESIAIINNLGLNYILQGRYDDAIALLTPYSAKEPVHAKIIENLALAHCLKGNEAEAKKLYKNRLKGNELNDNLNFCKTFEKLRKSK